MKTAATLCLSALFVGLAFSNARGEPVSPDPAALSDKVDALMQTWMKDQHIPGLAVAVVKDGNLLKAQVLGLANVELGAPVRIDTAFQLGSVSEPFVATAIMMLVEEGKLGLDDPAGRYLDKTPRAWKKITIRQLLSQTSGISDDRNEPAVKPGRLDTPGSNTNYDLLAMIIRKITGQSCDDFLRARIFGPSGMLNTTVYPNREVVPGLAAGYVWENHRLRPGVYAAPATNGSGSGGILSTVRDMARWSATLDTETLLKSSSLQQMWTPVRLKNGTTRPHGFGWHLAEVAGHRVAAHASGWNTGFSAGIYRLVDDQLTVIVLANRFPLNTERFARQIAGVYLPAVTPPDYQPVPDPEPEITARVRDIMDRADRGKLRAADFTPTMWAEWAPRRKQMQHDGAARGPVLSLTLVERTREGDRRSCRYRVELKDATGIVHVAFDGQNRVTAWKVEDMDLK